MGRAVVLSSNTKSRDYRTQKFFNVLFFILFVPYVLVAAFCIATIISTKSAGGHINFASLIYAVKVDTPAFADAQNNLMQNGQYQCFKSSLKSGIKTGDIVVYYSGQSDNAFDGTGPQWNQLSVGASAPVQLVGASQPIAQVSFAKIGSKIGVVNAQGKEYVCFSYFSSQDPTVEVMGSKNVLFLENIIGVATQNQPFLMNALMFCSSANGFLLLVVAPCGFLLFLRVLSIFAIRRYASSTQNLSTPTILRQGAPVSYNSAIRGLQQGSQPRLPPRRPQSGSSPILRPPVPPQGHITKSAISDSMFSSRISQKNKK